jgi:hypothetical protein
MADEAVFIARIERRLLAWNRRLIVRATMRVDDALWPIRADGERTPPEPMLLVAELRCMRRLADIAG